MTSKDKNILKQILKESLVNEGTWLLPKDEKTRALAIQNIKDLEFMKESMYNYLGDDLLYDHIDNAIQRIRDLINIGRVTHSI
jgi:hypothetical protein